MVAADLLAELDRLGVRLALNGEGFTTQARKGALTPELAAALRTHKPLLLGVLKLAVPPSPLPALPPLPEPLGRLVHAAAGGQLPGHSVALPDGGRVPNLADYVLAWAATYAAGGDTGHCLRHLWAAHAVWQPRQAVSTHGQAAPPPLPALG
ncbi:hypothetical protein DAETH_01590 [Deinococcus aetherius]|uniref:TubC N-terminal docking domain-containing protein n=1 Tax=Deinococcus aetherius TaxID=200252 RepID=A0ABN6RA15_9DEIO|nr:hypothetical protein DAETH_01590 [Deinococcus aetherius]